MHSTGRSVLVLALGLLAAEAGALWFDSSTFRLGLLLVWYGPVGLAGVAAVAIELARLAGDAHGRVAGIESGRTRFAFAFGLAALLAVHAAPVVPPSGMFQVASDVWARWIIASALALVLLPWTLVPFALLDERVGLRAALGASLSQVLRAKPSELLFGPILFLIGALAADVGTQVLFGAAPRRHYWPVSDILFRTPVVPIVVVAIALGRWALVRSAALARTGIRLASPPTASGVVCVSLPIVLALAARAIRPSLATIGWASETMLRWFLDPPAILAGVAFAWVVFECIRFRGRERQAAVAVPTLVLLDAADVELEGSSHRLRGGATLTLTTTGATVTAPAAGMRIHSVPRDVAPGATLDAWVDEPLQSTGTAYRSGPPTFSGGASLVIGSPAATRAERITQLYGRIALPFMIGSAALVLSVTIAFAMTPALARGLTRWGSGE